jgi:hypothetical protein
MKSRQQRVRAIELSLTPQQVVMAWLRNAQAGTFEEGARHSPPCRGAVANEVLRSATKRHEGSIGTAGRTRRTPSPLGDRFAVQPRG